MFKKHNIKRIGFSGYSQIGKWLFGASVFVAIALVWGIYFFSTQYLGKSNANISGIILFDEKPLIDVNVSIGDDSALTDENGYFSISNISYGRQKLIIEKTGYQTQEKNIFVWKKSQKIGKIKINKDTKGFVVFSGNVFDSFNKKPLKGAIVEMGGSNTMTNDIGEFQFDSLERGDYTLSISAIGYKDVFQDISIGEEKNISKDFFLSPYGKISFTSSRDGKKNIYSIGYDGKDLVNYTAGIKGDCWSGEFTGDGKKLIFYSDIGDEYDQWGQKISNLYFINKDSSEPKKINRDMIIDDIFRLSSNGDRVLFLGKDKITEKKELYISSIGKIQEWIQLTDNDVTESNYDISSDGNLVVFGAFEGDQRKIYLIEVGQKIVKPIITFTDQTRESKISFSPDGKSLFYTVEGYNFDTRVFVYDITSNKSKQIYRAISGIKDITWSNDGKKIAFIAIRDDRRYIYSINSDGSNETKLLEESGNFEELLWPPLEKILIVKIQDGDARSLAVLDITQRKLQKVENILNDQIGWQQD